MIIQIRGTSGSGKTWVMRQVMSAHPIWVPHYYIGRKKPICYTGGHGIAILGHYESTCGGCDNVGSAPVIYKLIQKMSERCSRIVCEGLLLSEDTKWSLSYKVEDLRIIFLTTPLEQCLKQIQSRREQAGNFKELNPTNTINRVKVIERARKKLLERGVDCCRASPEQAVSLILNWLKT